MEKAPIITLENVGKTFVTPTGPLEILRGVSLTVQAGEKVAIIGPSGSGKSTLLSLMGLLDTPTTGEIKLGEVSVGNLSDAELARLRNEKIGFVFQSFELIAPFTVRENITAPHDIAGTKIPEATLNSLVETTRLGDRLDAFPRTLSGGEKQRVAIARALAQEPALILADEPTGSLDRVTGERVLSLLLDATDRYGAALVIITHDESVAARMDRVYHITDGGLYAQK